MIIKIKQFIRHVAGQLLFISNFVVIWSWLTFLDKSGDELEDKHTELYSGGEPIIYPAHGLRPDFVCRLPLETSLFQNCAHSRLVYEK